MATRYAERLREAAASIRNDGTPAQVGLSADECDEIAAAITALEAAVEQAFRDGLAYATNCVVTDPDEAWRTSRARASIESKP